MATRRSNSRSRVINTSTINSSAVLDDSNSSSLSISRLEEKDHLTSLNSRLAQYIDRVRQLEAENSRLTVQIRDIEVVEKAEKSNIAERFDNEIARLRRLLEQTEGELTKAELERAKASADSDRLRVENDRLRKDLNQTLKSLETSRLLVNDLESRTAGLSDRLKSVEKKLGEAEAEVERLRRQLAQSQKSLEDEIVLRHAAQKKIDSLLEEIDFNKKQHKAAMDEVRHKRQVDMTAYAQQVNDEYQHKLQDKLSDLRAQFQEQLANNKAAMEDAASNRANERSEASQMRARIRELEMEGANSGKLIEGLRSEIEMLRRERDRLQSSISGKDDLILELKDEIARLMTEFQELMDVKIQLDSELRTYQTLLEGEEERLHLSQQQSPARGTTHHVSFSTSSSSANRGKKRRRVELNGDDADLQYYRSKENIQKETTGPVGVDSWDEEHGKWVCLINNSDEDVSIGSWVLTVVADRVEVVYKFTRAATLPAHETVTIYSANAGEKTEMPNKIAMRKRDWPVGPNPSITLTDDEGDTRSTVVLEMADGDDADVGADRCTIM